VIAQCDWPHRPRECELILREVQRLRALGRTPNDIAMLLGMTPGDVIFLIFGPNEPGTV
jgi:DNA-binding CsgD family transcriptional regulator